jgi:hypothetical protein
MTRVTTTLPLPIKNNRQDQWLRHKTKKNSFRCTAKMACPATVFRPRLICGCFFGTNTNPMNTNIRQHGRQPNFGGRPKAGRSWWKWAGDRADCPPKAGPYPAHIPRISREKETRSGTRVVPSASSRAGSRINIPASHSVLNFQPN